MPQLLICGEQTKWTENRLSWPASFRNGGRLQIGMVAGFKSESLAGLNRNSHAKRLGTLKKVPRRHCLGPIRAV
jgi:hypothetical protein